MGDDPGNDLGDDSDDCLGDADENEGDGDNGDDDHKHDKNNDDYRKSYSDKIEDGIRDMKKYKKVCKRGKPQVAEGVNLLTSGGYTYVAGFACVYVSVVICFIIEVIC